MYDHRKHVCRYCLQAFSADIKDCFKINDKQRTVIPKKREFVKFKNYERKIKSPFIIYTGFVTILLPENNGKENPEEFYTN